MQDDFCFNLNIHILTLYTSVCVCVFSRESPQLTLNNSLSPCVHAASHITSHWSEWPSSINEQTTSAGEDVEKGEPLCTVVGMQSGAAPVITQGSHLQECIQRNPKH